MRVARTNDVPPAAPTLTPPTLGRQLLKVPSAICKKDLPIIIYGLLTDGEGRPDAMDVYPGDPTTVPDQVEKLRQRSGLARVVLVGDRSILTQAQIGKLQQHPGLG